MKWLVLLFVLCSLVVGAGKPKPPLFSKTRWWPTRGTLHKMTLWHEHLELREPFPPAKKLFSFVSNEAAHGLVAFSESDAHKILRGAMDVETWLVATYFAERVLSLAEKKEQKECSFTCLFKFKESAKNLHVTVRIERNKNEELYGELIMRGHRKEPTPEIVNLISAVLIDDVWLSKHWGKMLCVFGTAFAWFKRGSIKRSRSTSMLPVSEDVGIKIPLKQDHVPPAQSCKLGDVHSQQTRREVFVQTDPLPKPEIKYSQDGEAQTDPLPEPEVKLAQDGEAQTVPVLVPLEKEIGVGAAHVDPVVKKMRDVAMQTLAPKPIPVPRKPLLRAAATQTEPQSVKRMDLARGESVVNIASDVSKAALAREMSTRARAGRCELFECGKCDSRYSILDVLYCEGLMCPECRRLSMDAAEKERSRRSGCEATRINIRRDPRGTEYLPELTPEVLRRAMLDFHKREAHLASSGGISVSQVEARALQSKTRILEDGSLLFVTRVGVARVVLSKLKFINESVDLCSLWLDMRDKVVPCDVVIVLYCKEENPGDKESFSSVDALLRMMNHLAGGVGTRLEGFVPCCLMKKNISPGVVEWSFGPENDCAATESTITPNVLDILQIAVQSMSKIIVTAAKLKPIADSCYGDRDYGLSWGKSQHRAPDRCAIL